MQSVEKRGEVLYGKEKRNEGEKSAFEQKKGDPWSRNGGGEAAMHVTLPFFRFLELHHCFHFYPYSCLQPTLLPMNACLHTRS